MAKSTIPIELQDVKSAMASSRAIFGEMLGWGAREAISTLLTIYNPLVGLTEG
jgi:hypothetical protein